MRKGRLMIRLRMCTKAAKVEDLCILPNIDEDQDQDEKRQVDDKAEDVYEGCEG